MREAYIDGYFIKFLLLWNKSITCRKSGGSSSYRGTYESVNEATRKTTRIKKVSLVSTRQTLQTCPSSILALLQLAKYERTGHASLLSISTFRFALEITDINKTNFRNGENGVQPKMWQTTLPCLNLVIKAPQSRKRSERKCFATLVIVLTEQKKSSAKHFKTYHI